MIRLRNAWWYLKYLRILGPTVYQGVLSYGDDVYPRPPRRVALWAAITSYTALPRTHIRYRRERRLLRRDGYDV